MSASVRPLYLIFTDGSAMSTSENGKFFGNDITVTGYAYAICNVETRKIAYDSGTCGNRIVYYAEIYAIYKGLARLAYKLEGKEVDVIVVSDNKACVKSLTEYMDRWKIKYKGKKWKVSASDIYHNINELMTLNPNMRVHVVHMHSHKDGRYVTELKSTLRVYNVCLTRKAARFFININKNVDKSAHKEARADLKMFRNSLMCLDYVDDLEIPWGSIEDWK